MTATREQLRQFFGGYFHQDWDIEGATASEILHVYFRDHPSTEELMVLVHALRELMQRFPNDDELYAHISQELWCEYFPGSGLTRSWLSTLLLELDAEVGRRATGSSSVE
jgi:hypothetical protein